MRTATGNVTSASGNLTIELEVERKSKNILFRAMNELEHDFILGIDFCSLFDVDVRLGPAL